MPFLASARRRLPLLAAVGALVGTSLVLGVSERPAEARKDVTLPTNVDINRGTPRERFYAGDAYTGYYADPSISLINGAYYTTATNADGVTLPVMTSQDLVTFRARPALQPFQNPIAWPFYNDAMPVNATWPATLVEGGRNRVSLWAPSSVVPLGGRYVVAYSAAKQFMPSRKSCVSLAYAESPTGPFVDPRSTPLYCYDKGHLGAIDPDIHVDAKGRPWLLWKDEGVLSGHHPKLMSRRLTKSGSGFTAGSRKNKLLTLTAGWEGRVVENPSMVTWKGRTYLFYSGGAWNSGSYATGYAICDKPKGPCRKMTEKKPLMASTFSLAGPGGADAFVDAQGRLRVAYHAWDAGRVGETLGNARRMHIGRLGKASTRKARRKGKLRVLQWFTTYSAPGPAELPAPTPTPTPTTSPTETPTVTPSPGLTPLGDPGADDSMLHAPDAPLPKDARVCQSGGRC